MSKTLSLRVRLGKVKPLVRVLGQRLRRRAPVVGSILGTIVLLATLIGPPDMPTLSYRGEIDFRYTNSLFEGRSSVSQLFLQNLGYPFPTVNFTADPTNDSFWGFTIVTAIPGTLWIENESGLFITNFTAISSVGLRNWDYFVAEQSTYWLNASSYRVKMNVQVGPRLPYAWPWLTLDSELPRPSADIFSFATLRSVTATSKIVVVANDLSLQLEGGDLVNLSGKARLTFRSFDEANFWLTTGRASFLLHPGTRVEWFAGTLSLRDASGYIEASNGDQRPLENATMATLRTPREVHLEVASLPGDGSHILIRLDLETTTVEVEDVQGRTVVGARNENMISISGWPGKWLNIILVLIGTGALVALSWVAPADDRM